MSATINTQYVTGYINPGTLYKLFYFLDAGNALTQSGKDMTLLYRLQTVQLI